MRDSSDLPFCICRKLEGGRLFAFPRIGRLRANEQQAHVTLYGGQVHVSESKVF